MKSYEEKREYRAANRILELLQSAGYEAYFVGGSVRNELIAEIESKMYPGMQQKRIWVTDIDVTTNALPEDVKRVFSNMKVIETGIKHGTVTVMLPLDDSEADFMPIEITTYRTETGYSDGRHPDKVEFTSCIEEDLARRDFTVNAMAMDLNGKIVDPFGGEADLRKRVIKCVGDPDERFREDALRIMRALRFAAVLDFEIEPETKAALFRNKHMLVNISSERIFTEFKKLLVGKNAGDVIREYVDVLSVVISEMGAMKGFDQRNPYHKYDVLEHCVRAMEIVKTTPENEHHMKMAALFHDIGKPLTYSVDDTGMGHFYGHAAKSKELTDVIFKRLKVDNAFTERVGVLVEHHGLIFKKDEKLLKKWMNRFTPEILFEILDIKRADNLATGNMSDELKQKFNQIEAMMLEILEQDDCFSLKKLAVDGKDVMQVGIKEGPEVGLVLNKLLEAVIDGQVANEPDALLKLAGTWKNK